MKAGEKTLIGSLMPGMFIKVYSQDKYTGKGKAGCRIGQREKPPCGVDPVAAAADPTGNSGV